MFNKIISWNFGQKEERLLTSRGETFEDVWRRLNLPPYAVHNQGDPREWPCEDVLEEAYARELALMSLQEGATALRLAPTIDSPYKHLISFIDNLCEGTEHFPDAHFIHVFTSPYCRLSMDRNSLSVKTP